VVVVVVVVVVVAVAAATAPARTAPHEEMPNEGGDTTAMAATGGRNPYSKEKTCGGREDSNAIADPAKRRKRSTDNDNVLGKAL
jgi:hypothetical protein